MKFNFQIETDTIHYGRLIEYFYPGMFRYTTKLAYACFILAISFLHTYNAVYRLNHVVLHCGLFAQFVILQNRKTPI